MIRMYTWAQILLALLVLPAVAMGGALSVCACHHEVVYSGESCGCGHGHVHEGEEQKPQPAEHHCTHVENEMQPVPGEIQVPLFDWVEAAMAETPNFRRGLSRMHSLVALSLEHAGLWEPPDTRLHPLRI